MARHRQVTEFGRDSWKTAAWLVDSGLVRGRPLERERETQQHQTGTSTSTSRCGAGDAAAVRPEADDRREEEEEGGNKSKKRLVVCSVWCGLREMSSEGLNVQIDRLAEDRKSVV